MTTTCLLALMEPAWNVALGTPEPDDLGEAAGLTPESVPGASAQNQSGESHSRPSGDATARGYARVYGTRKKSRLATVDSGPDGELGVSMSRRMDHANASSPTLYLDGRLTYESIGHRRGGRLDQTEIRVQFSDLWSGAIGKERNRRSPGLIVSPSDFLHSQQSLPGMPEERGGVWLIRASRQSQSGGVDIVALPFRYERDNGMPDVESSITRPDAAKPGGIAVRTFARTGGFDLELDAGRMRGDFVAGASIQKITASGWKSYLEAGWTDANKKADYLAGIGYEGSSDWSSRIEIYHHGSGLDRDGVKHMSAAPQSMFMRKEYAIVSVTFPEIRDRLNLVETWIRGLEDRGWLNLARAEWIVDGADVAGITLTHIATAAGTQFARRPLDWQAQIDWKTSF